MYFILKKKNHIKSYKKGDNIIFNDSDFNIIHGEGLIFSTRAPLTLLNENKNDLFILKANDILLECKDFNLYKLYKTMHINYIIEDIEYINLEELFLYGFWSEHMKELFRKNINNSIQVYILEPLNCT